MPDTPQHPLPPAPRSRSGTTGPAPAPEMVVSGVAPAA
jgi:hypothetical protein